MDYQELIKWRTKQGYTQQRLAELLGTTATSIFRWEHALRSIPPFLPLSLLAIEDGHELGDIGKKRKKHGKASGDIP